MGLDMYLCAEACVTNYRGTDDQKAGARTAATLLGLPPDDDNYGSIEIKVHAGYWRKANAIHAWFVENVQDGVDECQQTYVSRDQLRELKRQCSLVLSAPGAALETLPPRSGFFFGSTDVDEYYLEDLKHTVEVIDRCLACPDNVSFSYRSSW